MGSLRDKQKFSANIPCARGEGDSDDAGHGAGTWCKWALPGVSTGRFAQAEALTWSLVPWDSMEGPRGEGEARWWATLVHPQQLPFCLLYTTSGFLVRLCLENRMVFLIQEKLEKPGWCSG